MFDEFWIKLNSHNKVFAAKNLEELGDSVLDYYLALNGKLNIRNKIVGSGRFIWVNGEIQTLSEIGDSLGVTRERIRQIEKKLGTPQISMDSEPVVFQYLKKIFPRVNTELELIAEAKKAGLCLKDSWSLLAIRELAEVIKQTDLIDVIDEFIKLKINIVSNPDNISVIRQLRSKIGLINLDIVKNKLKISEALAFELINIVYKRSVLAGGIVLARGGITTTFEASIGRQLTIKSPLPINELIVGLRREANKRRYPIIGNQNSLSILIERLYGSSPTIEGFVQVSGEIEDFAELDRWIIEKLQDSPLGMLHTNEWVKLALKEGKKTGSIFMYLSNSPILRSLGDGVTSLVGTVINPIEVKQYRNYVLENSLPTELSISFEGSNIILNFKPSLGVFASGVIIIKNEVASLIREKSFVVECECSGLSSESNIELSGKSFWTGFSSILKHGVEEHGRNEESNIIIKLDFDKNKAILRS